MRLVYKETKCPVQIGDPVDLQVGRSTVRYFTRPHSPASSGWLTERYPENGADQEHFVSVIGAEWVEREDRGEA